MFLIKKLCVEQRQQDHGLPKHATGKNYYEQSSDIVNRKFLLEF